MKRACRTTLSLAVLFGAGAVHATSYDVVFVLDVTTSMYSNGRIEHARSVLPDWYDDAIVGAGDDAQLALVLVLGDGSCVLKQDLVEASTFFDGAGAFMTFEDEAEGSTVNFAVALSGCVAQVSFRPARPRTLYLVSDLVTDDASTLPERDTAVAATVGGFAGFPFAVLHVDSGGLASLPNLFDLVSRASCNSVGAAIPQAQFDEEEPALLAQLPVDLALFELETWPCHAIFANGSEKGDQPWSSVIGG